MHYAINAFRKKFRELVVKEQIATQFAMQSNSCLNSWRMQKNAAIQAVFTIYLEYIPCEKSSQYPV